MKAEHLMIGLIVAILILSQAIATIDVVDVLNTQILAEFVVYTSPYRTSDHTHNLLT